MRIVGPIPARSQFLQLQSYGRDVLADFIEANIVMEGLILVLDGSLSDQPDRQQITIIKWQWCLSKHERHSVFTPALNNLFLAL